MERIPDVSVAVVCGGPSAEAEVSRSSGGQVAEALAGRLPRVTTLEYGPDLADGLREAGTQVVFPVMHGPPGEDGTLQGFLDTLGMPYVGSGVLASACAMHKPVAKAVFRAHGLPVARDVLVAPGEDAERAADRVVRELGLPVVCKPVDQGSAIGVAFCHEHRELLEELARAADGGLLVEELVAGRELTVGVLERDDEVEALPAVEITTPEGTWYDFEHRYTPGYSEHLVPAPVPDEVRDRLQEVGRTAHLALGCRDLSRADLVLTEDHRAVLLEVNTLPGMTATSLYPDAAAAVGVDFEELVTGFVLRAHARGPSTA